MLNGRPSRKNSTTGEFDLRNRFHSQGLAAGGSELLDAINKGKVHLAKFILEAGDYDVVNTRDFNGKTPLIRACYIQEEKTRDKTVLLLLSKGAGVNVRDDAGRTCLSYACELRCNDIVRILVQNNADPDIPDDEGNTPLMYNAMVGNDVALELLVRSFRRLGLGIDRVNRAGLSALLIAAQRGFTECASILATYGRADVTYRDPARGWNAEQWARERGCAVPEVLPFSVSTPKRHQLRLASRAARCAYAASAPGSTDGGEASADARDPPAVAGVAAVAMGAAGALNNGCGSPRRREDNWRHPFHPADPADLTTDELLMIEACAAFGYDEEVEQENDPDRSLAWDVTVVDDSDVETKESKRYKRNSLPVIRLWSSLDIASCSPGHKPQQQQKQQKQQQYVMSQAQQRRQSMAGSGNGSAVTVEGCSPFDLRRQQLEHSRQQRQRAQECGGEREPQQANHEHQHQTNPQPSISQEGPSDSHPVIQPSGVPQSAMHVFPHGPHAITRGANEISRSCDASIGSLPSHVGAKQAEH